MGRGRSAKTWTFRTRPSENSRQHGEHSGSLRHRVAAEIRLPIRPLLRPFPAACQTPVDDLKFQPEPVEALRRPVRYRALAPKLRHSRTPFVLSLSKHSVGGFPYRASRSDSSRSPTLIFSEAERD